MDQEIELMSVALSRYADSCPPTLHPDCPHAEEVGGRRTCHTQCRDEIIRLAKPGYSGGAMASGPLFDARQCLLSETTDAPDSNWHTSSLIQQLQSALLHPPRSRDGQYLLLREIDATNSLAYLGQRGFDPDWILRSGLAHTLPTRLALRVIDQLINPDRYQNSQWLAPWVEIFQGHVGEIEANDAGQLLAAAHRNGLIDYVRRWLQQAPLYCIVGWVPVEDLDGESAADDGQARWMIDRFTATYLRTWSEGSLHHEYRYLRGMRDAPVPIAEMMRRQVTEAAVNRELARRSVEETQPRLAEVTSQALALLNEGRNPEAAALFDAARILDPQDAEAHNNYGFCLIPDDPEEALEALVKAEDLGIRSKALNLLNQSVALRRLGRPRESLAAADRAHAEVTHRSEHVWLWDFNAPSGPAISEFDLAPYIRELGLDLAVELGDENQTRAWIDRSQGEVTER